MGFYDHWLWVPGCYLIPTWLFCCHCVTHPKIALLVSPKMYYCQGNSIIKKTKMGKSDFNIKQLHAKNEKNTISTEDTESRSLQLETIRVVSQYIQTVYILYGHTRVQTTHSWLTPLYSSGSYLSFFLAAIGSDWQQHNGRQAWVLSVRAEGRGTRASPQSC